MQNMQENGRYESMRKNIQYVEIMFFAFYCAQDNFGVKKNLGPLEKPLEITDCVFCPHQKLPPAR